MNIRKLVGHNDALSINGDEMLDLYYKEFSNRYEDKIFVMNTLDVAYSTAKRISKFYDFKDVNQVKEFLTTNFNGRLKKIEKEYNRNKKYNYRIVNEDYDEDFYYYTIDENFDLNDDTVIQWIKTSFSHKFSFGYWYINNGEFIMEEFSSKILFVESLDDIALLKLKYNVKYESINWK